MTGTHTSRIYFVLLCLASNMQVLGFSPVGGPTSKQQRRSLVRERSSDGREEEAALLKADLERMRCCGRLRFGYKNSTTAEIIDGPPVYSRHPDPGLVGQELAGLRPLALDHWRQVERREAKDILMDLFCYDLAYRAPIMSLQDAKSLAERFFVLLRHNNASSTFEANSELTTNKGASLRHYYFTNFDRPKKKNFVSTTDGRHQLSLSELGWIPATDATFDGGIVAMGTERGSTCTRAAAVWFEDED